MTRPSETDDPSGQRQSAVPSWIIAAAGFLVYFVIVGSTHASGLIFVTLVSANGLSRLKASGPFTATGASIIFVAPLTRILGRRYSPRVITVTAVLLFVVGYSACYYSKNLYYITFFHGIVRGAGLIMSGNLLPGLINTSSPSTVMGFASTGTPVAAVVFPHMVHFLLDEYGLRGTFLLLGGLGLHAAVGAMLLTHGTTLVTPELDPVRTSTTGGASDHPGDPSETRHVTPCSRDTQETSAVTYEVYIDGLAFRASKDASDLSVPSSSSSEEFESLLVCQEKQQVSVADACHGSVSSKIIPSVTNAVFTTSIIEGSAFTAKNGFLVSKENHPQLTDKSATRWTKTDQDDVQLDDLECRSTKSMDTLTNEIPETDIAKNNIKNLSILKQIEVNGRCLNCENNHITDDIECDSEANSNRVRIPSLSDILFTSEKLHNKADGVLEMHQGCENALDQTEDAADVWIRRVPEKVPPPRERHRSDDDVPDPHEQPKNAFPRKPTIIKKLKSRISNSPRYSKKQIRNILSCRGFYLASATEVVNYSILSTFGVVTVDYLLDKGIEIDRGVFILTVFGLAQVGGSLGLSWIHYPKYVTRPKFNAVAMGLCAVLMFAFPHAFDLATLLVLAGVLGMVHGAVLPVAMVTFSDYLREEEVLLAVSLSRLIRGISSAARTPMIGFFRDRLGSYDNLFRFVGGLAFLSHLAWLLEAIRRRRRSNRLRRERK